MKQLVNELMTNVPVWVWVTALAIAVLLVWLLLMFRYRRLAGVAQRTPVIAPVSFGGAIPEDFKQGTAASLQFQLDEIIETFRKVREKLGFRDTPVEIGREFSTMMELSSASLNLDPSEHPTDYKMLDESLKKITIKTKWIEAPLSALINIIVWLLRCVPVPYRNMYLSGLIHVSFVSVGDEMQITVHRRDRRGRRKLEAQEGEEESPSMFTCQVAMDDKISVFRNTAFMILELHGKAFPGLKWRGMRYFTDGLAQLDLYRRNAQQACLDDAKEAFRLAVEADPIEYEACCFLGSILVAERTEKSINMAIRYFEQALQTDRPNFKAFIHAGLAHCYVQQYHRLARRRPDVLAKAREQAEFAAKHWQDARSNPWIQYTRALPLVIDEGVDLSDKEMKLRFIPAINLCLDAIQREKDNGLFNNALGWMLLNLVQRGIPELTAEDNISKSLVGNVAKNAEHYLLRSIEIHKTNKMSHANLCLLYATPHFLREDRDRYFKECKFYGEKAVQINPNYINGYRDLTTSMIRYGELDEAYRYFLRALKEAYTINKDLEIIDDVVKVLVSMGAEEEELKRWRNPPQELLEPPAPPSPIETEHRKKPHE